MQDIITKEDAQKYLDEALSRVLTLGVSSFIINDLEKETDPNEITRLQYVIVSEIMYGSDKIKMLSSDNSLPWLDILLLEVYKCFRGNKPYSDEKVLSLTAANAIIGNIAYTISKANMIDLTLITIIVSIVFYTIIKISISTWCDWFYINKIKKNNELQRLLNGEKDD